MSFLEVVVPKVTGEVFGGDTAVVSVDVIHRKFVLESTGLDLRGGFNIQTAVHIGQEVAG